MKKFSCSGFALLEILAMTVLMVGLAGLFISFSHNKQKQANDVETAGILASIANNVLKESAPGGTCNTGGSSANLSLEDCITVSDQLKNKLEKSHINPDDIRVTNATYNSDNSIKSISIILRDTFSEETAATYAQIIFNHLTPESLSYLSSEDTASLDVLPFHYYQLEGAYTGTPSEGMAYTFYVNY